MHQHALAWLSLGPPGAQAICFNLCVCAGGGSCESRNLSSPLEAGRGSFPPGGSGDLTAKVEAKSMGAAEQPHEPPGSKPKVEYGLHNSRKRKAGKGPWLHRRTFRRHLKMLTLTLDCTSDPNHRPSGPVTQQDRQHLSIRHKLRDALFFPKRSIPCMICSITAICTLAISRSV